MIVVLPSVHDLFVFAKVARLATITLEALLRNHTQLSDIHIVNCVPTKSIEYKVLGASLLL